jgi:hypothetical protein
MRCGALPAPLSITWLLPLRQKIHRANCSAFNDQSTAGIAALGWRAERAAMAWFLVSQIFSPLLLL